MAATEIKRHLIAFKKIGLGSLVGVFAAAMAAVVSKNLATAVFFIMAIVLGWYVGKVDREIKRLEGVYGV